MKKISHANRRKQYTAAMMAVVFLLTGCAFGKSSSADRGNVPQTGEEDVRITTKPLTYDSVDTAIVIRYRTEEKTISLRNLETGRQYTLSYDGTTLLSDKNGQAITMRQLNPGDLVDVTFIHYSKTLVSLKQSPDAFLFSGQTDYRISETGRSMTINGGQYRLAEDLAVFADGELISLMDINGIDTLSVRGFEHEIHSICVERGHGYLRLKNDEAFIGGWIEVGPKVIVPITENMLLTVPEGTYDVIVSGSAGRGSLPVTIGRNQEQTVDIGNFVVETKEGRVLFDVIPANAAVYVDGMKIDLSQSVNLTYGVHHLLIRAEGYESMVKYLSVGQPSSILTLELEKAKSDSDKKDDKDKGNNSEAGSGSQTGNDKKPEEVTASDGSAFYVTVTAPVGAEVYVDGIYTGIAPVRFKKTTGSHVISLRRSGYMTRSYTVELDAEKKDVTYSFSELQKEENA